MSVALVTGGSRGIGRGIVEALAAAGHKVAFTYAANHEAAAALVAAVEAAGGSARAFPADVDTEGNSAFRTSTYREMGGMDPLLFGMEGTELSYRIRQQRGEYRTMYWPGAVIRHDYASTDGKLACGGTCYAVYDDLAVVELTASQAVGSTFTGWSGACSGRTGSSWHWAQSIRVP